jgi:aminoglycoside 6-adenylyltransferase
VPNRDGPAASGASAAPREDDLSDIIRHPPVKDLMADFSADENIRAAVLTSSRARDDRSVDTLSDYDLEVHVRDIRPFTAGDEWFESRGELLVKWPLLPRLEDGWLTRLVQYRDGLRIDFQITHRAPAYRETYNAGYRVLIDKDGAASGLPTANADALLIRKPTEDEFAERVNAFFWDSLYVPKALRRGEEFHGFSMLADLRFRFIRVFTEWRIGLEQDWNVGTNKQGRWFARYLDAQDYAELCGVIDGSAGSGHWGQFAAALEYGAGLCREIARGLGYDFPEEQYAALRKYADELRGADCE